MIFRLYFKKASSECDKVFHEIKTKYHFWIRFLCFGFSTFSLTYLCLFHLYLFMPSISFQTFLYRHLKLSKTLDSMLLLYVLWDDRQIFMISRSNEQLQQQLEYTLLKSDCHSWWISNIQSYPLEERYAIKFCFKLEKNATETYGTLQIAFRPSCMNRASVFEWPKRFKKGREPVKDDGRCGRSKEVNTLELIGQRVMVRVTTLRF